MVSFNLLQQSFNSNCKKECFKNKSDADYRLIHIQKMNLLYHSKHKTPIRAYKCDKCDSWHLTSQEKRYNVKIVENNYIPVYMGKWALLMS